jgi:hypothetical protein
MRRALFAFLVVCLVPAASAAGQPPALRASLAACESGATPAQRFAVFTGSMPALAGTRRMWMRFDLLEKRRGAKRWHRLKAPAFGHWDRSKVSGASGFIYTKRVERLKEDARYRAVVRFRWIDAKGHVQRERRRVTRSCTQPSQRPNLVVESVAIAPSPDPQAFRYIISVANDGPTAAGAFSLGLRIDGPVLAREVPGIAAGGRTTVEITAPRCREGADIAVTLDIARVVREASERDNAAIWPCGGR